MPYYIIYVSTLSQDVLVNETIKWTLSHQMVGVCDAIIILEGAIGVELKQSRGLGVCDIYQCGCSLTRCAGDFDTTIEFKWALSYQMSWCVRHIHNKMYDEIFISSGERNPNNYGLTALTNLYGKI